MTPLHWQAAPLQWGKGPTTFEIFLEPTCPFSCRALGKLKKLLREAGEDQVTIKLRFNCQPWHLFSGVVTRCVLAASTLPDGRDKALAVLEAVAENRDEFVCESHCLGPHRNHSLNDVIHRLEELTRLALVPAFEIPDLDSLLKWHARYARQNGVHATPSFMINGVLQAQLSSGDEASKWVEAIQKATTH